jgi:hypothetical protein
LLFRQATSHETLLHPFPYAIDFKRALNFGEAQVTPDAVVQRAMRHSSPETKRHYQLGMVEQVRQNLEKANERVYGKGKVLTFL